jgi:hypothetical protein
MWNLQMLRYILHLLGNVCKLGALLFIIGIIAALQFPVIASYSAIWLVLFLLIPIYAGFMTHQDFESEFALQKSKELEILKARVEENAKIVEAKESYHARILKINDRKNAALNEAIQKQSAEIDDLTRSLKEQVMGFPVLLRIVESYEKRKDDYDSYILTSKKHPAIHANEKVKEHSRRRREAETAYTKARTIIEYYESIAPFLIDLRTEEFDRDYLERNQANAEYSEDEKEDSVTLYLTKQEYRSLSISARNQLALDRYLERKKSKEHIGKMYERFVGYLYETTGYSVDYRGIIEGINDMGIDLICKNKDEHILIQCKCWSKHKSIFENHIFQFFGTTYIYRKTHSDKRVRGIFYTTTTVSELAKQMGQELGVEVRDNHQFDFNYPCIKCNISKASGEKIYHLPFDQMYDRVKIEADKGEFYCKDVTEAEAKGFRRAQRHLFLKP